MCHPQRIFQSQTASSIYSDCAENVVVLVAILKMGCFVAINTIYPTVCCVTISFMLLVLVQKLFLIKCKLHSRAMIGGIVPLCSDSALRIHNAKVLVFF